MMKKPNIKVHLTEEQTENNSGMINPQAVNDVRRAAGSGGSGSGSGGSGSGDFPSSGTNETFTKSFTFEHSEEGITWNCSAFVRVHLIVYSSNSVPRFSVATSNLEYRIEGSKKESQEGTKNITENGNIIISNFPIPLKCDPYYGENTAKLYYTDTIHLVISRSVYDSDTGKTTYGPSKDFERTLKVELEVTVSNNSNSVSFNDAIMSIS
jgi:hypothetical protein